MKPKTKLEHKMLALAEKLPPSMLYSKILVEI